MRLLLQGGTVRPFPANEDDDVGPVLQGARRLDDQFQPLLRADIAGIKCNRLALQPPFAAQARAVGPLDRLGMVRPVPQFDDAVLRQAHLDEPLAHLGTDRGDNVGAPDHETFESARHPAERLAIVEKTGGKGHVHFEVLNVQPERRTAQPGRDPGDGEGRERRCDGEHGIGPFAPDRAHHRHEGTGCEARIMAQAAHRIGPVGNVERTMRYLDPAPLARFPGAVELPLDAPARVVRLACDHAHAVATLRHFFGEARRIGSDPDQFGRVIETEDEQRNRLPARGGAPHRGGGGNVRIIQHRLFCDSCLGARAVFDPPPSGKTAELHRMDVKTIHWKPGQNPFQRSG